ASQGSVYEADFWLGGKRDETQHYQWEPTQARTGQLRLLRQGSTLYHLASDGLGGEFQEIGRNAVANDTVGRLSLIVCYNVSPAPVDGRVVDLRVRSGSSVSQAPSASSLEIQGKGSLAIALLLGLFLILLAVVVLLVSRRRRERAQTAVAAEPKEGLG